MGSRSVTYCFQVTVTLTSGLNSRKFVSSGHLSHCNTFFVSIFFSTFVGKKRLDIECASSASRLSSSFSLSLKLS